MTRSKLTELAAFVAVAEALSFRAAAARLGTSRSALSHAMRQLEQHLDVRLLHRTTRSVALTDQGQRLLERLRPALSEIEQALADLDRERAQPSGRLRLHVTASSSAAVLAPIWSRFVETYPGVRLDVKLVDGPPIDVVAQGYDAAIVLREWAPADMVAVRVSPPFRVIFVASPAYLARHGEPATPTDLAAHDCIHYPWEHRDSPWPFTTQNDRERPHVALHGAVTVNNTDLAVRAAADGLGIACVAETSAEPLMKSGRLVRVLDAWSSAFDGYFLIYSGRRQVPSALRALIDMLRAAAHSGDSGPPRRRAGVAPSVSA
jgi:DNA-binding transcriptional LysR family regulator